MGWFRGNYSWPPIDPPQWNDRAWRVAYVLAGFAPLVTAVVVHRGADVVTVAALVLLAGRTAVLDRGLRHAVRPVRRIWRRNRTFGVIVGLVLFGGPVGGWLADWWLGVPWLTGLSGALILSAVCLVGWLGLNSVPALRVAGPMRFLLMPLSVARKTLLFEGWVPALVATLHQLDSRLTAPALCVMVVETAVAIVTTRSGNWRIRIEAAAVTPRVMRVSLYGGHLLAVNAMSGSLEGGWLYDQVLYGPAADYSLIELLLAIGKAPDHMAPAAGMEKVRWTTSPNPTGQAPEAATLWAVEHLLDMFRVTLEMRGASRRSDFAGLKRNYHRLHGLAMMQKAEVSDRTEQVDIALVSWRAAIDSFTAAGMPNYAALATANRAHLRGMRLGRGFEALRELEPMLDNEKLAVGVRVHAMLLCTQICLNLGELDQAERLIARVRRLPWRPRHTQFLHTESPVSLPLATPYGPEASVEFGRMLSLMADRMASDLLHRRQRRRGW
ncbi:hypothetical protein [Kutzneria sp. NPDC052558]|uniref:hypothetical protein n=1 Tax=Kutzneria sp. NPDC052558 TaxID=3364121 RepID=UPI0037CB2A33